MKNETDLEAYWPEIQQRGVRSLQPNFARRVMQRVAAAREEFSGRQAMMVGLSTALACLALTLAVNLWSVSGASDDALSEWRAFDTDDTLAVSGY